MRTVDRTSQDVHLLPSVRNYRYVPLPLSCVSSGNKRPWLRTHTDSVEDVLRDLRFTLDFQIDSF